MRYHFPSYDLERIVSARRAAGMDPGTATVAVVDRR